MTRIVFLIEAGIVWIIFHFFALLPVDLASAIGGFAGRHIGYHLGVTQYARRNLERFLGHLSVAERENIIRNMWENLGRNIGEYPHIPRLRIGPDERIVVEGGNHIRELAEDGLPGMCFSGHFGNWELLGPCANRLGLPLHLVYRSPNNPLVDWAFRYSRKGSNVELIPKGSSGARRMVALLARGEHIGFIIDQKMNDGISVPFFGVEAMTAPAMASLAIKFGCPVIPARIIRTGGAHFRLIIDPPVIFPASDDRNADILAAMTRVNQMLEQWIREYPDHWLWLHRRWPDE